MADLDSAVLVLADGTVFQGRSIGARGMAVGEVVFNTAMTGYQEILTDPSYFRQIVTLTYPHIGNTGVNGEDWESDRIYAAGLVVRDLPRLHSSWRSPQTLDSFLKEQNVVAIADIDTRRLTRLLRSQGAQNGCLMAGEANAELALSKARDFPGLAGMDLAKVVTAQNPYEWSEGRWELGKGYREIEQPRFHVVAYDYGIKRNILRMLAERGSRVTVVPAQFPAKEILRMKPDGVFLSIASGAKTVKMKFGHHGANHPVKDLDTGRVVITSQNHGFAVDPATLPPNLRATHVSLFDGSLQGFARTDRPAFCFQGHPEASPGPHDIGYLFDRFAKMIDAKKN
ncbi:MAG: carbamoyl phosphate synthase small subunit [Betaproteobacteria bacterium]|nr:MAG: carbamoyl phosphate synthase small subunit [Betaproteobacteria bacterium]